MSSESSGESRPRPPSLSGTGSGQDPVNLRPGIPKFQNPRSGTAVPLPTGSLPDSQLGSCAAAIQGSKQHLMGLIAGDAAGDGLSGQSTPSLVDSWKPLSTVPAPGRVLTLAGG